MFIVGILYYVLIGRKFIATGDAENLNKNSLKNKVSEEYTLKDSTPLWKKNVALLVLCMTIVGTILSDFIGLPFHVIAWTGAIILVLSGAMSEKEAMNSLDMQTIFLIVGTLSIGTALEKTGAGAVIAQTILSVVGSNPRAVLGAVLIVTTLITNFMSNTASAALLAPIGISIAAEIGADPRAVLMAIAIGASASYATPIGSPPNTMVYGVGGFKFIDYVRVGLPLIVINFIITMIILPILFPFYP